MAIETGLLYTLQDSASKEGGTLHKWAGAWAGRCHSSIWSPDILSVEYPGPDFTRSVVTKRLTVWITQLRMV